MGLETIKSTDYPDKLNADWPLGSDDFKYGDDHIRALKAVLKNFYGDYSDKVTDKLFPQFKFEERHVDPDDTSSDKYWHGSIIKEALPKSSLTETGIVQVTDSFDTKYPKPGDDDYKPPVTDPDDKDYVAPKALTERGASGLNDKLEHIYGGPYAGKFYSVWTGDETKVVNIWGHDKVFLIHSRTTTQYGDLDPIVINNSDVLYVTEKLYTRSGLRNLTNAEYVSATKDEFNAVGTKIIEIFVMATEDPTKADKG